MKNVGCWIVIACLLSHQKFLRGLPGTLPAKPKAILIISGHWETEGFALTGASKPELLFDYYNFPEHTYRLQYDAPGAPELAQKAVNLLTEAGLPARIDPSRGLDQGVFVPLKVAFPAADIPIVEMSVDAKLDPALHLAAGRALASLRDEGVLIIATGTADGSAASSYCRYGGGPRRF